jgi:hypothetical protein
MVRSEDLSRSGLCCRLTRSASIYFEGGRESSFQVSQLMSSDAVAIILSMTRWGTSTPHDRYAQPVLCSIGRNGSLPTRLSSLSTRWRDSKRGW